jgi:Tat-targeted selenate reductase subunit YnfE
MRNRGYRQLYDLVGEIRRYSAAGPDDRRAGRHIPNDYAGNMGYLIFIQPVTSAKFERKPIYWILSEVAKRLGDDIHQKFTEGIAQEQWLQHLYAKMLAKDPALPSYDELKDGFTSKDPTATLSPIATSANPVAIR